MDVPPFLDTEVLLHFVDMLEVFLDIVGMGVELAHLQEVGGELHHLLLPLSKELLLMPVFQMVHNLYLHVDTDLVLNKFI